MEDMSSPRNPTWTLEMPCWSLRDYDQGEWTSYPERQGYGPRTHEEWHKVFNAGEHDLSNLIKTWIFWGYYDRLLNRKIHVSSLAARNTRGEYVFHLGPLLQLELGPQDKRQADLLEQLSDVQKAIMGGQRVYLASKLSRVHFVQTERPARISLLQFLHTREAQDLRDPVFLASSMVFGCLALHADFLQVPALRRTLTYEEERLPWNSAILIRMLELGWCYSEARLYRGLLNPASCYFLSRLKRPHPERTHDGPRGYFEGIELDAAFDIGMQSGKCSSQDCKFQSLDESQYIQAHDNVCGDCKPVRMSEDLLASTLEEDDIPIVRASQEEGIWGLEVRGVSSRIPYVALSHVWSDGLGNPNENAIPTCRLRQLNNLVRAVLDSGSGSDGYFWLDTLCVKPDSDDAGSKRLQTLAINKMRETYAKATYVLVLEHWLMNTDQRELDPTELSIRLIASPWNRRLWTLQEAALAGHMKLLVQFKDGHRNVDEILGRAQQLLEGKSCPVLANGVAVLDKFRQLATASTEKQNEGSRLRNIISHLMKRRTSMLADEPICIANLARFDTEEILAEAGAEVSGAQLRDARMLAFWKRCTWIPSDLLFEECVRLNAPGFRWAPNSLLEISGDTRMHTEVLELKSAFRTDDGLKIALRGMSFRIGKTVLVEAERLFVLEETSQIFYRLTISTKEQQQKKAKAVLNPESLNIQQFTINAGCFAILARPAVGGHTWMSQTEADALSRTDKAAIVMSITGNETDQPLKGRITYLVTASRLNETQGHGGLIQELRSLLSSSYSADHNAVLQDRSALIIKGRSFNGEREMCIE